MIAVILPQGMLHEEVEANPFMTEMLKIAQKEFSPALQKAAFELSEEFNKGNLEKEVFRARVLEILSIPEDTAEVASDEFWILWNRMVRVGDVQSKLNEITAWADQNGAVVYIISHTNKVHQTFIRSQYPEALQQEEGTHVGRFPLFLSCEWGTDRLGLVEGTYAEINAKEFKPGKILLIHGDPQNIQNSGLRSKAVEDKNALEKLCNKLPGLTLTLHNKKLPLLETLDAALLAATFQSEVQLTATEEKTTLAAPSC